MLYAGFRGCQIGSMPSPENQETDFLSFFHDAQIWLLPLGKGLT